MTNNTPDYEDNLYFNSQNTKKDLTSEQLTEQWKKGKLPEGFYYIKCDWSDEVEIRYVHNGVDDWKAIFAEVPSYDEWEAAQEQLHKEGVWYTEISHKKVLEENAQLKELLEECRHIIGIEKDFATCHFEEYTLVELLTKIDEALK